MLFRKEWRNKRYQLLVLYQLGKAYVFEFDMMLSHWMVSHNHIEY